MSSIHGPQWDRDEEFRQSVIRKALLLGFNCAIDYQGTLWPSGTPVTKYSFQFDGHGYGGYASVYSAAFEYLRLMKVPPEIIGDYRG